jgi:hypothetical protein
VPASITDQLIGDMFLCEMINNQTRGDGSHVFMKVAKGKACSNTIKSGPIDKRRIAVLTVWANAEVTTFEKGRIDLTSPVRTS